MSIRIFCLSFLTMCAWCGLASAQIGTTEPTASVRVEQLKPTVYVSLERKDKKRALFRLNNNTTWAIAIRTWTFYFNRTRSTRLGQGTEVFTLPSDVEIDSLHYYVEKEPMTSTRGKPPELHYPESSSISWIPSKGSILFSVPLKHLHPGLMIYVPFNYEWELNRQLIFNKEPEHRTYFRGVDVSEKVKALRRRN